MTTRLSRLLALAALVAFAQGCSSDGITGTDQGSASYWTDGPGSDASMPDRTDQGTRGGRRLQY